MVFIVLMYYFHDFVHGSRRVAFFYEVLCETGGSTEVAPCCHVFFIAGGELPTCLSDVRFVAVGASQFVYPR